MNFNSKLPTDHNLDNFGPVDYGSPGCPFLCGKCGGCSGVCTSICGTCGGWSKNIGY